MIYHNSQDIRYRCPLGAAAVSSKVTLSIDAAQAASVSVRLWWNETGETLIPMQRSGDRFTAEIAIPEVAGLLWYYFLLTDASGSVLFYGNNAERLGGEGSVREQDPVSYQITVYKPREVPAWYKNALCYQIFPDRFARGSDWFDRVKNAHDPNRRGPRRLIHQDWDDVPFYTREADRSISRWSFFGGTIQGICEKLDYLKSLGVTALYLNPIFKAASNHRYDTADYMTIDPMLGDEETFKSFCAMAEERGISVILDGVFSHTGADSIYFDRYGNYGGKGAYPDEHSPYKNWYRFKNEERSEYESWWGVKDLPNVDELEPTYLDFITGKEGVIRRWLQCGARGWRLDVADELPDAFIEKVRSALKEQKPDGVLIGEVWEDASNKESYGVMRRYFSGDELDAVMNYPLRDMLLRYAVGGCDAAYLCKRMKSLQENYPPENFYGSFNLISGHDRMRTMTALGQAPALDAESERERYRLPYHQKEKALKRIKMLATLQYASPGVPCTYYGDEAGVEGYEDPFNRGTYPWGRENGDILNHYRVLGQLYHRHTALKDGNYTPFFAEHNVYGFYRENAEERLLILANPGETEVRYDADIEGVARALELISSVDLKVENGRFSVYIPPMSAVMVLLEETAAVIPQLERSAGVICHISSVPGGKMGKGARRFVDFLCDAGIKLWQILPLNPVGLGESPYMSSAVFAGERSLIDPDEKADPAGFEPFCRKNAFWLDDYAVFSALRDHFAGAAWQDWPADARDRADLGKYIQKLAAEIKKYKYEQYEFFAQWDALRAYAASKGIAMVGDIPIYAATDGVDTWANREVFQLDAKGHLKARAGVPPDYFTPEGQDWGNPLYDWQALRKNGYDWWIRRMQISAERFDAVRLDHFRGFSAYYSIPAGKSAKEGSWQHGPDMDFFRTVYGKLGRMNIIAEDLGILDAEVYNLIKLAGLPGMNVYQFHAQEMANMSGDYAKTRVFYSGTHDNQTLLGWCQGAFPYEDARQKAMDIFKELYKSDSPWVIFQLQDLLLLGDEARMNVPGTPTGNWKWQADEAMLTKETAQFFRALAEASGRLA